ncbi:MAG: Clp protease N-terminal domain-containing protein [Longimicrobiales bacterium]
MSRRGRLFTKSGKPRLSDSAFTDRARETLARARAEAMRLDHAYVGTEHVLLALTRDEGSVACSVLMRARLDIPSLRRRIEDRLPAGTATSARGNLSFTLVLKRVLLYARKEAASLHHGFVGTEHILLALTRDEKGVAGAVLRESGLDHDMASAHIASLFSLAGGETTRSPFRILIDDTSSDSIYEQIIAQVQEAVATGALEAGDRLPPVRRLADDLDIAPGTVARAYGELERLGVVMTEGARGTRIADRTNPPMQDDERAATLLGLLRPVVVAAFHLGADAGELRAGLEGAMAGIMDGDATSD